MTRVEIFVGLWVKLRPDKFAGNALFLIFQWWPGGFGLADEVARDMTNVTGGSALAERPPDSVGGCRPADRSQNPPSAMHCRPCEQPPPHRITRPAEGLLSGLPGAVTDLR